MIDQNGRTVVNPTTPIDMAGFANLYEGGSADIPIQARDYVSSQWGNTGMGGRPEDFFTKLRVNQQLANYAGEPKNAEGFAVAPNRSPEGFALPSAPTTSALATRGTNPGRIATLQNLAAQHQVTDLGPIDYLNKEDLVRQQLSRGGGEAEKILLDNTYQGKVKGFNWQNRMSQKGEEGSVNYSGIEPIHSADDLLKNPAFTALAARDPNKASSLYNQLTGMSYEKDMAERFKQRTAMLEGFSASLRKGFEEGKLRRNPATGWLERDVSEPNPMGIGPAQKVWEPADPVMQHADKHLGETALGMARQPTILDNLEPEQHAPFHAEYQRQIAAGKAPQEAATLAFQSVPSKQTASNSLAVMQKAPLSDSPAGTAPDRTIDAPALEYARDLIKSGPKTPSERDFIKGVLTRMKPVELRQMGFPDLANAAMTSMVQQQGQQLEHGILSASNRVQAWGHGVADSMGRARTWVGNVGGNMLRGVENLPNKLAVMAGGKPLYPWIQPDENLNPTPPSQPTGFTSWAGDDGRSAGGSEENLRRLALAHGENQFAGY